MWKLSFYLENSGIVMNLKADASYVLAWLGGAEVQIPWQAQKAHKKGGLGNLHQEILLMLNEEGCGPIRLHEAMLLSHNPLQKNKQTKKKWLQPKAAISNMSEKGCLPRSACSTWGLHFLHSANSAYHCVSYASHCHAPSSSCRVETSASVWSSARESSFVVLVMSNLQPNKRNCETPTSCNTCYYIW